MTFLGNFNNNYMLILKKTGLIKTYDLLQEMI